MREQRADMPYLLIGHSAGGQFLSRLAAFEPGEATRIVAANPGGLIFPTRAARFPYGFGGLPAALSDDAALRRYLAAPLTIYLGTGDNDPNHPTLGREPEALVEGATRLARGRNCYEAGRKLASEHGWTFNWRKVETPGIGHDGASMFAAPEALEALLGKAPHGSH
jgi:pimeloyl-ACP methyl ester carboxylesterase